MADAQNDATSLNAAYEAAADDVRRLDKDRFLASLFVPEPARRHILALLAFSAEIARVRDVVSDPMPGEVRLQWWRDTIEARELAAGGAPPIARALVDTIESFNLPRSAFINLIDARVFDLYDDPMPSVNDLEGYCGETAASLLQLGAIVLAGGVDPGTAEVSGHAGVAYGLTGLLRALPFHAARGQIYVPSDLLQRHEIDPADLLAGRTSQGVMAALQELRELARLHLSAARAGIGTLSPFVRPVFLQLALIEPMLALMDRPGYDPFKTPIDIPQWCKQLRLWWAAKGG